MTMIVTKYPVYFLCSVVSESLVEFVANIVESFAVNWFEPQF